MMASVRSVLVLGEPRRASPVSGDHPARRRSGRAAPAERIITPVSPYLLQAGAGFRAALITGIRSDLPGQIVAQVTENIFDSPSGRYLLIPQGTRVIGEYSDAVSFGQRRVLLVWNRLIFPDGRSLVLERLLGADAQDFAGLEDGVDYHWTEMAKAAGLSTILAIGTKIGSEDDDPLVRAIREGAGDTITDAGQQIVERQLQVASCHAETPKGPKMLCASLLQAAQAPILAGFQLRRPVKLAGTAFPLAIFRYEKHFVYWRRLLNGDIGILTQSSQF